MRAARGLFAERGYANVSADDIVSATGLTRGALHHHFGDKAGLFRAVFEELDAELTAELGSVAAGAPDTVGAMVVGVGAFLDFCRRPEVVRICLSDAPAVLGWETWRAIEAEHGLGLITGMIDRGIAEGVITPQPPEVLAQLVLGVTIEAALLIANSSDPEAARRSVEPALITMLSGLLVSR
ncbi:MAG TPA: TetR/AcrR family transcriptional regulator [Actinophytocola sp.]|uniref:TetR/AcrR family transcriptional regulator n=1 Tax=Actinophytocola sp. TaxID=1872138 RepID=UPI002DDCD37C|nr:TetR/AcrR family transcriptional regulator [Actinophytocola sp.]HEV2781085.1 TetR/AcrR family transcriptional regulator [Actinophytocola sp.]